MVGALLEDALDELSIDDELASTDELVSLDELATDETTVLDAAELNTTELTTLDDELDLEPLLSDPPQAVKPTAMQRLSRSGDVFMVLPFLLLIALMVVQQKKAHLAWLQDELFLECY